MGDIILEEGRPQNVEGRLEKEVAVYDFLDQLGIRYWRTDHPDAEAYTMEACKEIDGVLGATVCKNLFLTNKQHTAHYLHLMPGDKVFKTKELSKQINSARLSFGSAEEMEEMINCAPGSASAMGLIFDKEKKVRLLIDKDILEGEYIGVHPCINTSSLKLLTRDLMEVFLPAVGHEATEVVLVGGSI